MVRGVRDWVFPVGAVQRWWHSELTKTQKSRAAKFIHEMLLQIIFMKCWETEIGPDIETSQQWQCHCRSLSSFTQTKLFTPSCLGHYHQASRANSFWGVSYLRWLLILRQGQYHGFMVVALTGEDIKEIILCSRKIVKIITHNNNGQLNQPASSIM